MSGSIYAATSGAEVQRIRVAMLSNNLANINTTGYKSDDAIFRIGDGEKKPDASGDEDAAAHPELLRLPIIPLTARTDFTQGPLEPTGNPLDLAIQGKGFFSIQTDDGIRYTRNGSFTINTDGILTTQDGQTVMGEGGPITIEGGEVLVDGTGNVVVDDQITDKIRIVEISDRSALRKEGASLFVLDETQASEEPVADADLHQGFLEGSNANAVKIMTDLIEAMRGYESYQKVIRTLDEMNTKLMAGVGAPI